MGKFLSEKEMREALFRRTEGYAASVRAIYREVFSQIIEMVKGTELEDGKPFSFSAYGYNVTPILRNMYSRIYQTVRKGVENEWRMSNDRNDELVKSVFGASSAEDDHFARYFSRNKEAMDAFFTRRTGVAGLNLSQRVWRYTGRYREELEDSLDLALGEGTPANSLAARIKKYLDDPDRYYRRFRVRTGVDADGNPVYGRKWKRRTFDRESGLYVWVDDDPGKYTPGRGVYRSSSRNAQRLARTETNIAYRTADYERWQELDFVVGVEIKLSNNHPHDDICDALAGRYPKDFKWTGWHPNCRCYMVPVLASKDEVDEMVDRILDGGDPDEVEVAGAVSDTPERFDEWVGQNAARTISKNISLPSFIEDNSEYASKAILGKQLSINLAGTMIGDNAPEYFKKYALGDNADIRVAALYDQYMREADKVKKAMLLNQLRSACAMDYIQELRDGGYLEGMTVRVELGKVLSEKLSYIEASTGKVHTIEKLKYDMVVLTDKFGKEIGYPIGGVLPVSPSTVSEVIQEYPPYLRKGIKRVSFINRDNPGDEYWKLKYKNPNHRSMATDGGQVNFWLNPSGRDTFKEYLAHEAGHILDKAEEGKFRYSLSKEWKEAVAKDDEIYKNAPSAGRVSTYAWTNDKEDFAECIRVYITDHDAFKKSFPNRAAFIRAMAQRLSASLVSKA